jgi:DNA-directed RNA polymerase specialized sigma subunit, sigma24 homolog
MSTPIHNEECIVAMYDSFAKTVLRNQCRKLMKSKKRRNKHETVGTAKMQYLLEREPYHDTYPSEQLTFCWEEYVCIISNETLYQAMMLLKEDERAILVLDFWYEMSDEEIADKFQITTRTVYNRRQRSFRTIKGYYERIKDEGKINT